MSISLFSTNSLERVLSFDLKDQLHFNKQLDLTYRPFYFNFKDDKDI